MKRFDRVSNSRLLEMFRWHLDESPLRKSKLGPMLVELSECAAVIRRKLGMDDKDKNVDQTGGQDFQRNTTKYWVPTAHLMDVKCFILQHLPIYVFRDPTKKGHKQVPTDDSLITSVYYDDEAMSLYAGRLKKDESAIAVRLRYYGDGDPAQKDIFVERKIHHESWVQKPSIKQRFVLEEAQIYPYLQGKFKESQYERILLRDGVNDANRKKGLELFREIQNAVIDRGLTPNCTTRYKRTAFQVPGNARVRISIDADLEMIAEKGFHNKRWGRDLRFVDPRDIEQFPYAVLEVKLQLRHGEEAPDWIQDLTSRPYVQAVPFFSKYIHGCFKLFPERTNLQPPWHEYLKKHQPKMLFPGYVAQHRFTRDEKSITMEDRLIDAVTNLARNVSSPNNSNSGLDEVELEVITHDDVKNTSKIEALNLDGVRKRARSRSMHSPRVTGAEKKSADEKQKDMHVVVPMKIEPKTYFANERTFLQWVNFGVILQGFGVSLIAQGTTFSTICGWTMCVLAVLSVVYALVLFRWRAYAIRMRRADGRYDDVYGPVIIVSFLIIGIFVGAILGATVSDKNE